MTAGRRLAAAVLALITLMAPAAAQPFAAAGGFDRAQRLGSAAGLTSGAVAIDAGVAYAYWDDGDGIVRRPLDDGGAPERVVEAPSVRAVLATDVDGHVAIAWVQRSRESGRSEYHLSWQGESRLVTSTLRQNPVALGAGPDGPALLLVTRAGSEAHLDLYRWNGSVVRVRSSERDLNGQSLIFDDTGGAVVAWLEGEAVRTEFGVESDWDAYAAYVSTEGDSGPANLLGDAALDGIQFVTRVDWPARGPQVAWTQADGALVVARPGQEPVEIGRGHPIGVFDEAFFWFSGTSIRRRPLDNSAAGEDVAENVVWSPNEPERIHGAEHDGHLHLVWYGGNVGGGFAVYAADDREPIRLDWRDRIAASMGWRPWDFWQAFAGQTLVSLLVGVLATMAMSPLLLAAAVLLSRIVPPQRGTLAGLALALAGLLVLIGVAAGLGGRTDLPANVGDLFGSWKLVLAVGLGAGLAWLLRRRADSETVFEIMTSAGICTTVTLALLAFLNFRDWTQLWSGLL